MIQKDESKNARQPKAERRFEGSAVDIIQYLINENLARDAVGKNEILLSGFVVTDVGTKRSVVL